MKISVKGTKPKQKQYLYDDLTMIIVNVVYMCVWSRTSETHYKVQQKSIYSTIQYIYIYWNNAGKATPREKKDGYGRTETATKTLSEYTKYQK